MTTISLKLPENLLAGLERESRARRTTKSSVVRECLEQQLPDKPPNQASGSRLAESPVPYRVRRRPAKGS